jgi:hypothetical protein
MKYLKITINPPNVEARQQILEELRTTTDNAPFVGDNDGNLYLSVNDDNELIAEVFSLGMTAQALFTIGIDDPFDFEIVARKTLPPEVAMAMN